MWDSLFSTFQIDGFIDYCPHAKRELDRYEQEIGHSLPKSYRDFCMKFGPGKLVFPFDYNVAVPYPIQVRDYSNIRYLNIFANDSIPPVNDYNRDDPDMVLASRSLYFCSDIDLDLYFWDIGEVTQSHHNEYAIYVRRRLDKVERLANSFFDFINSTCLVTGTSNDDPSVERRRTFTPAKTPSASITDD